MKNTDLVGLSGHHFRAQSYCNPKKGKKNAVRDKLFPVHKHIFEGFDMLHD